MKEGLVFRDYRRLDRNPDGLPERSLGGLSRSVFSFYGWIQS